MTNAEDPNIGEFLKHGKLLTYVGGADVLIPTYSTTYYRKLVADALGNDNLDDTYRTFIGEDSRAFPAQASSWANGSLSPAAPGVSHCSGGRGADGFGGPGQRQDSLGGQSQPLVYDAHHDMTLAMFDWVEKGKAPDYIIAAKYNNNNKTQGVAFTRPLCP